MKLIFNFFNTIQDSDTLLENIILMNNGVKLALKGEPTVEPLKKLEGKGVKILCCGTCLIYFDLKDKIDVGTISNMKEISKILLESDTVITL